MKEWHQGPAERKPWPGTLALEGMGSIAGFTGGDPQKDRLTPHSATMAIIIMLILSIMPCLGERESF
jgi:hypothetical protein